MDSVTQVCVNAKITYRNIPQMVGCPCQTASSWSGARAHPRGGQWEHLPEYKRNRTVINKLSNINPNPFTDGSQKDCENVLLIKICPGCTSMIHKNWLPEIRMKFTRANEKHSLSSTCSRCSSVWLSPLRYLTLAKAPVVVQPRLCISFCGIQAWEKLWPWLVLLDFFLISGNNDNRK